MNREALRHSVCCELVHDVVRSAGEVNLRVSGASMLPAIWPGDVLTVRRCEFAELHPDQIALYRRDGKLTAHRIQNLTGSAILTRGDSCSSFDPPVQPGEIVGRVESILRDGRTLTPEQRLWQRVVAAILRRSDLCLSATLFVGRRLRRTWDMQATPLSPSPLPATKR